MQTYPIRKSEKPKQYAFPIVVLAITTLLIRRIMQSGDSRPFGELYSTTYERKQQTQIIKPMLIGSWELNISR